MITLDDKRIFSGSWYKTLKLWNINTGKLIHTSKGHKNGVWSVAITPDGKKVVSGSEGKTLKLWNLFESKKNKEARLAGNKFV